MYLHGICIIFVFASTFWLLSRWSLLDVPRLQLSIPLLSRLHFLSFSPLRAVQSMWTRLGVWRLRVMTMMVCVGLC